MKDTNCTLVPRFVSVGQRTFEGWGNRSEIADAGT
jgi:hypothetical protein